MAIADSDSGLEKPVIGRVFDGKYRVVEQLGQGGMGVVFGAYKLGDAELPVAIKYFHVGNEVGGLELREAKDILREVEATIRLTSPHVVKVSGVSLTPPYIEMEWLKGETLRSRVVSLGRPLKPAELHRVILPVLDALEEAHEEQVIHLDLKPDNIFLVGTTGTPKVLDFGISKMAVPKKGLTVDTARLVRGTLEYMAKEQLFTQDGGVGPWTDIYSLGVMMYELLTGRRPYEQSGEEKLFDLALRIGAGRFRPLDQANPELEGHPIVDVVHRCLATEPTVRYQSISQVRDALTEAFEARPKPTPVPPSMPVPPPDAGLPEQAPGPDSGALDLDTGAFEPLARSQGRRWLLWAVALLVLVGAGVAYKGHLDEQAELQAHIDKADDAEAEAERALVDGDLAAASEAFRRAAGLLRIGGQEPRALELDEMAAATDQRLADAQKRAAAAQEANQQQAAQAQAQAQDPQLAAATATWERARGALASADRAVAQGAARPLLAQRFGEAASALTEAVSALREAGDEQSAGLAEAQAQGAREKAQRFARTARRSAPPAAQKAPSSDQRAAKRRREAVARAMQEFSEGCTWLRRNMADRVPKKLPVVTGKFRQAAAKLRKVESSLDKTGKLYLGRALKLSQIKEYTHYETNRYCPK